MLNSVAEQGRKKHGYRLKEQERKNFFGKDEMI
jgi:hypothetical protein